jgi:hypothetical protein
MIAIIKEYKLSDNVFDQNTTSTNTTPIAPATSNPFEDKLKDIVNEQGQPKYKDVTSALDALKASQDHIKRLEDEAKVRSAEEQRLREEAAKAAALEEIVNRMANNTQGNQTNVGTTTNAGTSEEAIIKTLEKVLVQKEAQNKAQANMTSVQNALLAKFGEKTAEVVAAKAAELGTSPQRLGALSSETPQAVLALFGLIGQQGSVSSPTTPSSTSMTAPRNDEPLKRPEKSLISGPGATDKNRKDMMAKIKDEVYKKYSVTT